MNKKGEFFGFRHQEAEYKLNKKVLDSENPRGPVRADDQNFISDLTEKGKENTRIQAEKFFAEFNPEEDAFFFVSSDFVRAAETGKIYINVAEERGFEVITPDKTGSQSVEKIGDGKIRHVDNLSLKINDGLIDQLFNHKTDFLKLAQERGVHLDEDLVARWGKAREIIEGDNKGSWSENWRYHSEEVKKIVPEIITAKKMFDTQFKNLVKLMEFGKRKIEEAKHPKKIRVFAFTHENLFTHWLLERWNESGMELGESFSFYFDPKQNLQANIRDKEGSAIKKDTE